jgi:hypothetical protein
LDVCPEQAERATTETRESTVITSTFTRYNRPPITAADEAMNRHPTPESYWVAPNQLLAGAHPSARWGFQTRRKLGALLDAGIRAFVDLTDTDHGVTPYDGMLKTLAATRGHEVTYRRMAIRDAGVPAPDDMADILNHIDREIDASRPVYVHCLAGIGRTGTVVGCWIVEKEGGTALQALDRLAQLRAGTRDAFKPSPETHEQREFLARWATLVMAKRPMSLRDRCDALLKFEPHFANPHSFATLVSPPAGTAGLVAPYCELSPWAREFVQAIEDANWCVPFDWKAWQDQAMRYVENPTLLTTADVDVVTKLLTMHVRMDRVKEGHLAGMAERGHLKAILLRLRTLRDEAAAT